MEHNLGKHWRNLSLFLQGIGCTKITKVRNEGSVNANSESRSYLEKKLVFCFGSHVAAQMLLPFGEENFLSSSELTQSQEVDSFLCLIFIYKKQKISWGYATITAFLFSPSPFCNRLLHGWSFSMVGGLMIVLQYIITLMRYSSVFTFKIWSCDKEIDISHVSSSTVYIIFLILLW